LDKKTIPTSMMLLLFPWQLKRQINR